MLSVFPEILYLSPFAPFLIRVALAVVFGYAAWQHLQRNDMPSRVLAVGEIAVAIAFVAGWWTQPAAILATIVGAIWFFQPTSRVYALSTILLSILLPFTLLITGAGALAFDLPL
ncbi:MAG: hypothetical protein HYS26_00395 [Candidatus Kaiserbacteria bacterium]|nr:MAG: hypothetical protein HYS26_00395 [Candidatus Kaiserbacteria bacterium]